MDKRQRNFLLAIFAAVALFTLVLLILRVAQRQTIPAPLPSPTETTAPAPPTSTSSPSTATLVPSTATPTPSTVHTHYVAPDGKANNDGSQDHPWPLQYVLDQPRTVRPGDTIWLLGGKYTGPFASRLKGAEGRPINVRANPGQRVTLQSNDLVLDIADSYYVNFWDLEITAIQNSRDPRHPKESAFGIRINQGKSSHDIKFIDFIIHDMPAQGVGFWQANSNSEIYGSLIYDNGITQFDHGIYVHNTDGEKRIIDNIIFDNASHGIHAYGEKDYQNINNIIIEGNTVFDNGSIGYSTKSGATGAYERNILVGGLLVAEKPVIKENYTYYPSGSASGEAFNLGYQAGSDDAIVEDNYFAGGQVTLGGVNTGLKIVQNTILGFNLASIETFGLGLIQGDNQLLTFKPASPKIFVRPNQYEPGRANITVYNWAKSLQLALSSADLQGVQIKKGDRYELHNVQDYFNDVVSGTYDGSSLLLPMTGHSVAQPMGLDRKPASTFPEFGAFVLIVLPPN